MFELIGGFNEQVVAVKATGRVHGDDYRSVLEPAVTRATAGGRKARMLIVLGPEFEGYDPSGVVADAGLGFGDFGSFERIAVVTDVGWIRDAIGIFAGLIPGDVRLFRNAEEDAASTWIRAGAA